MKIKLVILLSVISFMLSEDGIALITKSKGKIESREGVTTTTYLIQRATETYKRAQEALRLGDWARYGEETKRLGEILQQLN